MSRAAVFLDRDGTINVEKQYLYRYEDWEWISGAIEPAIDPMATVLKSEKIKINRFSMSDL